MALYTGVTGKIEVTTGASTAQEACLATFSVELSKEILEKICFGQEYKEKIPGIKDWTASSDGTADLEDAGQKALYDAYESGNEVDVSFYLNADTFFKGKALIESLSVEHAADGKADISISLSGSGGVLLTLPTGS